MVGTQVVSKSSSSMFLNWWGKEKHNGEWCTPPHSVSTNLSDDSREKDKGFSKK